MNVLTARFLNCKETPTGFEIRNRARQVVWLGLHAGVTRDTGYPLLPGQVLKFQKPVMPFYVVR